jgi:hypothetical protein
MLFPLESLIAAHHITRKAFIGVAPRTFVADGCSVHFASKTSNIENLKMQAAPSNAMKKNPKR